MIHTVLKMVFDLLNGFLMRTFTLRIEVPRDRRYRLNHLGSGTNFGRRVELQSPENISVGNRVTINSDCYLAGEGGINIGENVLIGPGVYIFSVSHCYDSRELPIRDQGNRLAPVVVDDNAWLGAHVVVLAGVTIGRGAIVAAGSVVNRDIPAFALAGGVPARVFGERPA